jgi:GGDEF domain-containing protein
LNLLAETQSLATAAKEFVLRTDRPASSAHNVRLQVAQASVAEFGGDSVKLAHDGAAGATVHAVTPSGPHGKGSSLQFETGIAPELLGRLALAVGNCRERRCELSLLVVAVDHYSELKLAQGPEGAQRYQSLVEATCRALDHAEMTVLPMGEGRMALALVACDRRQAVQIASDLTRRVRVLATVKLPKRMTPTTISVGAATLAAAPKNFQTSVLVESAERCLYAAQSSGGDSIKSIEI